MDAINSGAATVWHNQQQLEAEARLLHQQTQRLTKQTTDKKLAGAKQIVGANNVLVQDFYSEQKIAERITSTADIHVEL